MEKYQRQLELLGKERQQKLTNAKVLVIGMGGLGSPALMALAVAGIGTLGLVDYDTVDITNLNRQTVHDEAYIGAPKVASAAYRLSQMNTDIQINTYQKKLTEEMAFDLFSQYDIIVDCVDNYEARKLVSNVAIITNKTVIEGGIEGFAGFIQIIVPHQTACFNCLRLEQTEIYRQVLGASTGIVGNIQALECIKQITGLWNGSYSYIAIDLMTYDIDLLKIDANVQCDCLKRK